MIVVNNLKLRPGESEKRLQKMAAQELGMKVEDFTSFTIYKKSLDARRKNDIHFVYAVALTTNKGSEEKIAARSKQAVVKRPVVVGFGPGGMFAALLLTKAGLRPIVLERGGDVDSRQQAVDALRTQGVLDPENNVQFGEGGAGISFPAAKGAMRSSSWQNTAARITGCTGDCSSHSSRPATRTGTQ